MNIVANEDDMEFDIFYREVTSPVTNNLPLATSGITAPTRGDAKKIFQSDFFPRQVNLPDGNYVVTMLYKGKAISGCPQLEISVKGGIANVE